MEKIIALVEPLHRPHSVTLANIALDIMEQVLARLHASLEVKIVPVVLTL